MTSNTECFVWIWLPNNTEPVPAGKLVKVGDRYHFAYGRSYLDNPDAVSVYSTELPLQRGTQDPVHNMPIHSCLRDGAPDAWGRRVILNRLFGTGLDKHYDDVDELTFLLESGSDRIGALDFQASAKEYVAREPQNVTLNELMTASDMVDQGIPLTPALEKAIMHGTSIGGARPKALIDSDAKKYIAKFSCSTDTYSVVKIEYIAMLLAKLCGIKTAPVALRRTSGRDVLLVERFDRTPCDERWRRRRIVSGLTLMALDESEARYASYEDLAELLRLRADAPREALLELFKRIVFNILVGNTDDHARNHSAFETATGIELTPAYDICPQGRSGGEASHGMKIVGENNLSQLKVCLQAAPNYGLTTDQATNIIKDMISIVLGYYGWVCNKAGLSMIDSNLFWGRQFLNESIFYDAEHLRGLYPDQPGYQFQGDRP